jgi:Cof subfamily protein (haloacid dehalogenase superfamily)
MKLWKYTKWRNEPPKNPVGYFTSLARNPTGFNAPHFAVFKRLLFRRPRSLNNSANAGNYGIKNGFVIGTYMKIRLIAFDLDGTLLNSKKDISPRTREALFRAREKGILLVPCTGRHVNCFPKDIRELEVFSYAITSNGARVYILPSRELVSSCPFEPSVIQNIITECRCYNARILANIEKHDALDTYGPEGKTRSHNFLVGRVGKWDPPLLIDILDVSKKEGIYKVSLIFENLEDRQKVFGILKKRNDVTITFSDNNNVEIMPLGVNKGKGLEIAASHAGIDMENVMALGDSINDLEMIRAAGYGVAMGNAVTELKEAAKKITLSCDEDGVAFAIEAVL